MKITELNGTCPHAVRRTHDRLTERFGAAEFQMLDAVAFLREVHNITDKMAVARLRDVRKWGGFYT